MRCHSQALTIKLNQDIPLADIEAMIKSSNQWVKVVPNHREKRQAKSSDLVLRIPTKNRPCQNL
jgi:aspartate-semialdehyde dehydrogenase